MFLLQALEPDLFGIPFEFVKLQSITRFRCFNSSAYQERSTVSHIRMNLLWVLYTSHSSRRGWLEFALNNVDKLILDWIFAKILTPSWVFHRKPYVNIWVGRQNLMWLSLWSKRDLSQNWLADLYAPQSYLPFFGSSPYIYRSPIDYMKSIDGMIYQLSDDTLSVKLRAQMGIHVYRYRCGL